MVPFLVRLPQADGLPACIAYLRLQLSPGQDEVSLFVEPLLACDAVAILGLTGCIVPVAQVFKIVVDLLVQGRNGLEIAH